ncbi:hypothetical protein DB346_11380 [Verrucomicrobia bacterium LW23]|nr:hypothetical protein DB346_11380 [Verrucomicrobia bacterium LW23]
MAKSFDEERLLDTLRHTEVVLFRVDTSLRYTWVFNLPECFADAGLIGKSDGELLTAEEAEPLMQSKLLAITSGEPARLPCRMTLCGHTRWFDLRILPQRNADGDGDGNGNGNGAGALNPVSELLISGHDVTERHLLAARLHELTHHAEEMRERSARLESLGLLAGGIAHDFNNFLAGLAASISLAQTDLQISLRSHEYLQAALDASFAAQQLTRQLLTFTKGQAPHKHACDMRELLEDATHFALRGSSVAARFEIDPALWTVEADAGQIRQVIHNIVLNARQAMPEGGTIRVMAANAEPGVGGHNDTAVFAAPSVAVTIQDTGTGIAEELRDRIFMPYFTTKGTGTGLGLSTSQSIVQRHGGSLTFTSTPGVGTAFTVRLPAQPGLRVEAEEEAPAEMRGSGRILVMDDNELIRKLVTEFLQNAGYEVAAVSDGDACLRVVAEGLARGETFDAYLLDLTIPGGRGGVDTLRELQLLHPTARAVATSGYAEEEPMIHFARHGFCDVLAKPFRFEVLAATLDRAMALDGNPPLPRPAPREVREHLHDVSL